MVDFTALDTLLDSDLTQLRAENGHATEIAITQFVLNLNSFFGQFSNFSRAGQIKPAAEEIEIINSKLTLLLNKLTVTEREYYQTKRTSDPMYAELTDDEFNDMASGYDIKSIKALRGRMQFWAATDIYGATIRNPKPHLSAVKYLDLWDKLYCSSYGESPLLFFGNENSPTSAPTKVQSSHYFSN